MNYKIFPKKFASAAKGKMWIGSVTQIDRLTKDEEFNQKSFERWLRYLSVYYTFFIMFICKVNQVLYELFTFFLLLLWFGDGQVYSHITFSLGLELAYTYASEETGGRGVWVNGPQ